MSVNFTFYSPHHSLVSAQNSPKDVSLGNSTKPKFLTWISSEFKLVMF